jgi:esterase/lipase
MVRPRPTAALALAVALVVTGCSGGTAGNAPSPAPPTPVADCISPDEQRTGGLRVPTAGGQHIDAVILGNGSTGVLLANMNFGDLCQWRPYADHLIQRGNRVLMFNYSGRGPAEEVTAAVDVLRGKGAERLFLVGASKGGTAVLGAAARIQVKVSGVVSLSAPQAYADVDALPAMPTFTVPVLFVVATNDHPFTVAAQLLYDACATKDKALSVQPGSSHGTALLAEDVRDLIDRFISSH